MPQWNIQVLGSGLMFRCIAICFVVAVVVFFPLEGVREHGGSSEGRWHMGPDLMEKSSESAGAEQLLWSTLFSFLTLKVLLVKICHYTCGSSVVDVVGPVSPQRLWGHIKEVFYFTLFVTTQLPQTWGHHKNTETWAGRVSLHWIYHGWVLSSFVTIFTVMRVFGP